MKLKFFIAGLAVVAGLASAVSCQDLTKDLTDLKSKVASLESTVQALQSKIDAGAVITSVTPSNSGILITLSNGNKYEITNGVNGKDGANGKDGKDGKDGADGTPGSVVTIGDNGNWFIDGVDTGLAAQGVDGEDGTPGAFFVPDPETGCFDMFVWDPEKGEYVSTPTEIPFVAEGTLTAVYNPLTGVVTLYGIEGYEGGYEIGGSAHGDAVTSVELLTYNAYEDFTEVTEALTGSFGPEGDQIEFAADEKVVRGASYVVRVSPANVTLSKDDVSLVNTKGETYDKFVIDVKPYDGVLTKSADFALWQVDVTLSEYDADSFLTEVWNGVPVGMPGSEHTAYGLKIGEAVTNYDIMFEHADFTAKKANWYTADPTYSGIAVYAPNVAFGTDIFNLKNRTTEKTICGLSIPRRTPPLPSRLSPRVLPRMRTLMIVPILPPMICSLLFSVSPSLSFIMPMITRAFTQ